MALELSSEVRALALAIEAAYLDTGPLLYEGRDLHEAVADVEQVVTETFIPNYCDPLDRPVGNRKEVIWWASVNAAKSTLGV